jgi:hypothetical protein
MKAIVVREFGSPEVMVLEETPAYSNRLCVVKCPLPGHRRPTRWSSKPSRPARRC